MPGGISRPEWTTIESDPTPEVLAEKESSRHILPTNLRSQHGIIHDGPPLSVEETGVAGDTRACYPEGGSGRRARFRSGWSASLRPRKRPERRFAPCVWPSVDPLPCVAGTAEDLEMFKLPWLLFKSDRAVQADCIVWDPIRGLALLRVDALRTETPSSGPPRISSSTSSRSATRRPSRTLSAVPEAGTSGRSSWAS